MDALFSALTHAIEGTPAVAVIAALVWGILSIVLSPCHLASIPLIVGYIDRQGHMSWGRALLISGLFATGILITVGLIGAVTAMAGRIMGDLGPWGNYFVALIFIVVGLHLLDVIPLPMWEPGQVGFKGKGPMAALLLGLIFGIALGPCTFAYMAPLLGVTFKLGSSQFLYAATLLLAYGVGHCSVIVAAGTCSGVVRNYLKWTEKSRGSKILRRICGALVLLGGMYLIYVAP